MSNVCEQCKQESELWSFYIHGNDGKKSYTRLSPRCKDCIASLGFKVDPNVWFRVIDGKVIKHAY